jgi:hypothetical protein
MKMINQSQYNKSWDNFILHNDESALAGLGISLEEAHRYRTFVQSSYQGILEKMFERISLWKDPDWQEWAKQYYIAYPPIAFELNDLTLNFPDFIRKHTNDQALGDLADYELNEFLVYKMKVSSGTGLRLNPAHKILPLRFDIASWVKYYEDQDLDIKKMPNQEEHFLVISRSPKTLNCVFTKLTPLSGQIYLTMTENDYSSEEQLINKIKNNFNIPETALKNELKNLYQQQIILKETQ